MMGTQSDTSVSPLMLQTHGTQPDTLYPGLTSTVFLIFNRIIGTRYRRCSSASTPTKIICSIFATPSVILRASGSVGLSFVMWLLGATIAACGTAVYIELGTVCCFISPAALIALTPPTDRLYREMAARRTILSTYTSDHGSSWLVATPHTCCSL